MKIDILTLFPEMFSPLKESIVGRATNNNLFALNLVNIRDFSKDKHAKVDDYPYSGGAGMVMQVQPIYDAVMSVKDEHSHVIYMSPKGQTLTQDKVIELSKLEHLVIICGHYEGIDQRAIDLCVDEEISIGDYVLTGGEIPAMALVDAVSRYIPNVLHNDESTKDESFSDGLLEYPLYTRPSEFKGLKVPDVLLSGNHQKIEEWKQQQKLSVTASRRKDLLNKYSENK